MLAFLLATLSIALIVFLLSFRLKKRESLKKEEERKRVRREEDAKKSGLLVTCPLCGSLLLPGEDLVSRVYRPMNVPDQLCTINGCPHCYPVVEVNLKRICPVCHREVPLKEGHLVARLFNKATGKKHVIVTGCTECCKGRR